jgi:hypothetical protein
MTSPAPSTMVSMGVIGGLCFGRRLREFYDLTKGADMKTLLLCLLASPCFAQTYNVDVNVNGQSYLGQFTYANGIYSNVSINSGQFTSIFQAQAAVGGVPDGSTYTLWFNNAQTGLNMGVDLITPEVNGFSQLGGSDYKGTYATVQTAAGPYTSCYVGSGCSIDISQVVEEVRQAPELDPSTGLAAMALLVGGMAVWRGRCAP